MEIISSLSPGDGVPRPEREVGSYSDAASGVSVRIDLSFDVPAVRKKMSTFAGGHRSALAPCYESLPIGLAERRVALSQDDFARRQSASPAQ